VPTLSLEFWIGTGLAILMAVLAIGVGVGMDTKTRGEYIFVVLCFCLSWLAIIVTIGLWYFHVATPSFQRAIVSGLFVAIATVSGFVALRWATDRHERAMLVEKGPQTSQVPTEPKPEHPKIAKELERSAVIPDPLVRVEPEEGPVPSIPDKAQAFSLTLQNDGPDIDHIVIKQEFFFATKDGEKITIYRVGRIVPQKPNGDLPLRTNQHVEITVDFSPFTYYYGLFGYKGYAGVKIIVAFRRFADEKDFTLSRPYAAGRDVNIGNFVSLSMPRTKDQDPPPPAFGVHEVVPLIDSDANWKDAFFEHTPDGKTRVIW